MKPIVIGSRGSRLALWQANHIRQEIERRVPEAQVRIEVLKTSGDKISESSLARFGTIKGLFVKEIEEALLASSVDLAVHSLKDVPTELPKGLCLGAILKREDARDALVGNGSLGSLQDLAQGAKVGTSSLRRRLQMEILRPDCSVVGLRGNVDTRIRKMADTGLDAIVLAAAGLRRLELEHQIAHLFSVDEMVPAIGQGALAVEIRSADKALNRVVAPLDDPETRLCTDAERAFLHAMGGGCQVPMGAHAQIENKLATFRAFVASPNGDRALRRIMRGEPERLQELALQAAQEMISEGAGEILKQFNSQQKQ
ncbi:MAG: hydroxymethylbilane synthase [Acidobacteriota bacterium]